MTMIAAFLGIGVPFILSVLGGVCTLKKHKQGRKYEVFPLGISAGVMLSTSVWSLLLPAINLGKKCFWRGVIPISVGFLTGFFVLLILDYYMEMFSRRSKKIDENKSKPGLLVFAMALHNIPEGITLGLAFTIAKGNSGRMAEIGTAILLSLGIGIQNFPESAAMVLSLTECGVKEKKAFYYSLFASMVEPVAAILAVMMSKVIIPFLPFLLAYAAGTMIHVTVEELIPNVQRKACGHIGTLGILCGFLLMMLLDIYL